MNRRPCELYSVMRVKLMPSRVSGRFDHNEGDTRKMRVSWKVCTSDPGSPQPTAQCWWQGLPQDAPVSEFLQAALLKQFQAEYIANLTNTSCTNLNNPQLSQIQNAILKIDNTLKQVLQKLNMSTDSNTLLFLATLM